MRATMRPVAVLLALLPLTAWAYVTIGNTRPIGDGVKFKGQILYPDLDLNSYRDCLVDTNDETGALVMYGGWTTSIASVDMCCIDRGYLIPGSNELVCEYGCPPPNERRTSPAYIAPYNTPGAPCLTNCIAIDGCQLCLPFKVSCDEHCIAQGFVGGRCAHPGSSNPAQCCDCVNSIP